MDLESGFVAHQRVANEGVVALVESSQPLKSGGVGEPGDRGD